VKTNTDAGIQIQVYYLYAPAAWVQVRNPECVCKRDCSAWLQGINPNPFGKHAVVQLVARYLKRMGYASNGHHSATYKNGFPEQQSNSTL